MIYATHDHDGYGCINGGADICAFSTREEAVAYLTEGVEEGDWEAVEGRFADCWQKWHWEPSEDELFAASHPFDLGDLRVTPPGRHPGGRQWWVEPRVDVLVLVYA